MIKNLKSVLLFVVCLVTTTAFAQDYDMSDLEFLQFNGPIKKVSCYKANEVLGNVVKEYLFKTEVFTSNGFLVSRRVFNIDGQVIMMDSCEYENGDKVKVYSGNSPDKLNLTQSMKYDSNHNVIEHIYYGYDGSETQKWVYTYKKKQKISWEWYTMGNLFRKYDYSYNKQGELIESRYDKFVITSTYQDGKLVSSVGTDGTSYTAEYDKNGNKIKEEVAGMVTTYKYQNGFLVESIMTRPDNEMTRSYFKGKSVLRTVQKNDKDGNPTEKQSFYSDGAGTPETLNEFFIFEYEYYK
ncbi:MAG: hypothetical protein J5767_00645 [Paludibacteraceae bacterium]|nr:hypothetical protein [Paludibacteraceae bacterium]